MVASLRVAPARVASQYRPAQSHVLPPLIRHLLPLAEGCGGSAAVFPSPQDAVGPVQALAAVEVLQSVQRTELPLPLPKLPHWQRVRLLKLQLT